jgi:hypothetical protein
MRTSVGHFAGNAFVSEGIGLVGENNKRLGFHQDGRCEVEKLGTLAKDREGRTG